MILILAGSSVCRHLFGSLSVVGSVDVLSVAVLRPLLLVPYWLSASDVLVAACRSAIRGVYSP
jgi:hypothetical protein